MSEQPYRLFSDLEGKNLDSPGWTPPAIIRIDHQTILDIIEHYEGVQDHYRGRTMPDGYMIPTELIAALVFAWNNSPDTDVTVSFTVSRSGDHVAIKET